MLMLQYQNLLLQSVLSERLDPETPPLGIDQVVSDFDNVTFHISNPDPKDKTVIQVSMYIKCFQDLVACGAREILKREYGPYLTEAEPGYDVSLLLNLTDGSIPSDPEEREELVNKIALLKRNTFAAPFEKAFDKFDQLAEEAAAKGTDLYAPQKSDNEVMAIHYRDEESIYVRPSYDRVTVIFSTIFKDETDRIFGKVFLQEFVDARKRAIQNAPQVLYTQKEPPLEIRDVVKPSSNAENMGYVTFVLFPRHLVASRRENCISHIQIFRDYFHYHIKCSKAYMHSRMRFRVSEFLKVLNRAKQENVVKEKKTASGRTFKHSH